MTSSFATALIDRTSTCLYHYSRLKIRLIHHKEGPSNDNQNFNIELQIVTKIINHSRISARHYEKKYKVRKHFGFQCLLLLSTFDILRKSVCKKKREQITTIRFIVKFN